MRKFKPAPKQASANRIRERYLHQLGLQRGVAVSASSQQQHWDDHHQNHVVVISGLPSLPEDRATNDNVLESHDFSHADGGSYITHDEGSCSKPIAASGGPPQHLYQPYPIIPQGDSSHCSRSTLSTSPHGNGNNSYLGMMDGKMADESMTSMALACPHVLLKSHQVHNNGTAAAAAANTNSNSALPFPLPWTTSSSQLSRSAAVLLDEAGGQLPPSSSAVVPLRSRSNTENSISSAATATTAESSFTATMVSRDWGSSGGAATTAGGVATTTNVVAIPQPTPSGTASVSSMGDSVTSAPVPGVFFQVQGSRVVNNHNTNNNSSYASTGPAYCIATSSLTSALNRFNIDSDCEASIASNSIIDDPTNILMDMDDSISCASHISGGSSSIASNTKSRPTKKKKIGKNQRLLERASAHERMIRSQKLRASVVHHSQQRVGGSSLGGLPMPHQLGGGGTPATTAAAVGGVPSSPARSCASSSVASHASSLPLIHVDHQATTPMSTPVAAAAAMNIGSDPNNMVMMSSSQLMSPPVLPKQPSFGGSDLGRTPTASNCSQQPVVTLPSGVYIGGGSNCCGPLNYRPQLASRIHMPPTTAPAAPSNVVVGSSSPPTASSLPSFSLASEMETKFVNVAVPSMQQQQQHSSTAHQFTPPFPSQQPPVVKRAESVEDEVMEVAVTLSMLGGGGGRTSASNGGGGMIPRVR